MLTLSAPAKVNLTLEVLGRRSDGCHDIASVFQAIDLADTLLLEPGPDLSFSCDRPELDSRDNLAFRAAILLQRRFGVAQGAHLRLLKRVPPASGLGGGSSDAAAALKGLARLWGLRPSLPELAALAQELGSDVPFFLYGGTALVEGRGERVTPLPPLPRSWALVLRPPLALEGKTGRMYAGLAEADFTSGQATLRLARALRRGEPVSPSFLYNAFEAVAQRLLPGLGDLRRRFLEAGAPWAHLCGSGPALFTLLSEESEARSLLGRLGGQGLEAYLAPTLAIDPEPLGL